MSKIYAVIGTNLMTVVADSVRYNPATNEVLMQSERPAEGDYVASADGTWKKDEPTTEEKLAALDASYTAQKQELANEYTDALIHADTDAQELVQHEMTELDEWYDEEYRKIEEENEEGE